MEQPAYVTCRDGVQAKVQLVAYEGPEGGDVFFGWRDVPGVKDSDVDGPDIWGIDGFWLSIRVPHEFDIDIGSIMHLIKRKFPRPVPEYSNV